MDKAELRAVIDRAFEVDKKFFRSFGLWDWLGLSCFTDEEIEKLNQPWRAFDDEEGTNPDFVTWLSSHDPIAHQRYKQQLDTALLALRAHTNFFNCPSIFKLRRAREQLDE